MKLTKEDIQFIDNYLIKNDVKYWDVRLELLDHIVSSIEDKMENKNISFNEALIEVHHGFGNRTHNGYTYDVAFDKALFLDNKGFKKFTFKKQKEIGRKLRKKYWNTFLPFITSLRFWLELIVLVGTTLIIYQYSVKIALFVLTISIVGVEFAKLFYGGFKKFSKKSLNMQLASSSSILTTQTPFLSMMFFNWYYEGIETKPYHLLFILFSIIFIVSRHSLNNYISIYGTYKDRYDLLTK